MRLRVIIAVGAALAAALLLMRDITDAPGPPARQARTRPARPPRTTRGDVSASTRNVFEYAARTPPEAMRRPASPGIVDAPAAPDLPPPAPPVRFVGLVRRGGTLKAALQVHGEPVVLGTGEKAGGYTVIGVDEDGARLRAEDGAIISVP